MLRLKRICSLDSVFIERAEEMAKNFLRRGYSKRCVSKALERVKLLSRPDTLKYKVKPKSHRVPFVITHNPMNHPLRQILRQKHDTLNRSERMHLAMPLVLVVGKKKL